MNPPLVSVVMATYNRSNIIGYSIESVRASILTEWELIVVGDHCTDETESVVQAFGDPRIRFVNLPRNCGEQSGPNNEGVRLSRGRYVAFLNHDDLWLPEHLAAIVAELERGEADLVFSYSLICSPGNHVELFGPCFENRYAPYSLVPASSWVFRRELAETVGRWREARRLFTIPSQEWLHRAWKRGSRLTAIPRVTVIGVPSSGRPGSYSQRQEEENAEVARRLREDRNFVESLLLQVAERSARVESSASVGRHAFAALRNAVARGCVALGAHPFSLRGFLLGWKRGAMVNRARNNRGLQPLPRRGDED